MFVIGKPLRASVINHSSLLGSVIRLEENEMLWTRPRCLPIRDKVSWYLKTTAPSQATYLKHVKLFTSEEEEPSNQPLFNFTTGRERGGGRGGGGRREYSKKSFLTKMKKRFWSHFKFWSCNWCVWKHCLETFFCDKLERLLATRHFSASQIIVGEG